MAAGASRDWQELFRPATKGWPSTPEDWELRPYFIKDYDISWNDLREFIKSSKPAERAWAVARILDRARWSDIWRLIKPEDVERDLDRLPRRLHDLWSGALDAWS